MLRSLKDLERYRVTAKNGDIGSVSDFFFDDERWSIRYMVVDTGSIWAGPHRVLISPGTFRYTDWATKRFHLRLTQDDVKKSPDVDLDQPISRRYEVDPSQYCGCPYYLGFAESWNAGPSGFPGSIAESVLSEAHKTPNDRACDPHLRSAKAVAGYHVQGSDEEIGHIADLIVDDQNWVIRYLVVDTSNWWFGRKVLVAPCWVREVNCQKGIVTLGLPRETIRNSPEWNANLLIDPSSEERLYRDYERPLY